VILIDFTPASAMGNSLLSWQVTSAAADALTSQDPGGRVTQFGLRITWKPPLLQLASFSSPRIPDSLGCENCSRNTSKSSGSARLAR